MSSGERLLEAKECSMWKHRAARLTQGASQKCRTWGQGKVGAVYVGPGGGRVADSGLHGGRAFPKSETDLLLTKGSLGPNTYCTCFPE